AIGLASLSLGISGRRSGIRRTSVRVRPDYSGRARRSTHYSSTEHLAPSAHAPMSATSTPVSALDIDVVSLSLEELWMPFTANRAFKRAPRLLVEAKGMYYTAADGRRILDGTAGLWCVNAGHCREPIARAIAEQAARMDYAPGFQMGHPLEFELASRLAEILPAE